MLVKDFSSTKKNNQISNYLFPIIYFQPIKKHISSHLYRIEKSNIHLFNTGIDRKTKNYQISLYYFNKVKIYINNGFDFDMIVNY